MSTLAMLLGIALSTVGRAGTADPVWRVQIRLVTDAGANSGTDDAITVSLNPDNSTTLNYARSDFESGDSFSYDLSLEGIRTVGDITRLEISKAGSDGWKIRSFALYINGKYLLTTSGTLWLDESADRGTILTTTPNLSGFASPSFWTPTWKRNSLGNLVLSFDHSFDHEEIVSRLECLVGDSMHRAERWFWKTDGVDEIGFYPVNDWDTSGAGAGISVDRKDGDELHVHLDLKSTLSVGYLIAGDWEILLGLDFDLRLAGSGGAVSVIPSNLELSIDSSGAGLSSFSEEIEHIYGEIASEILVNIQDGLLKNLDSDLLGASTPTVTIGSTGSVVVYR